MMCETIVLRENAMLKARPELIDEWDFEKNDELGLNVYEVTKGTTKTAWWLCDKCKSSYDMRIDHRVNKGNCPYCRGLRVNHTNSLANLRPELAKEWDFSLNELTPSDFVVKSNTKVWWKCGTCGGSYSCQINNRAEGKGCSYCSGKKVLIGFNDMWTTNPKLASLLLDREDGYKFTQKSNKPVNWKCDDCGSTIENKKISNIATNGLSCPNCSDGISFPEKFIYHILKENRVSFILQKTFEWAKDKRYDFYIEESNCIVEVHGEQHTTGQFKGHKRDEESNDKEKRELAKANGIEYYIEIDALEPTREYISKSIMLLETPLKSLLVSDFALAEERARGSFMKDIWNMWNDGLLINEISEKTKIHRKTIGKYLKIGSNIGKCDYTVESARVRSKGVKIIQLDKDMNFIKEWNTIKEAESYFMEMGVKSPRNCISNCCRGVYETGLGYKWLYADDYYKKK